MRETEGVEGVRDERRCKEEVERRHEGESWGERLERQRNQGKSRGYWTGGASWSTGEEMRGTVNIGALVSSNPLLFISFTSLIHRFLRRKPSCLTRPCPRLSSLFFCQSPRSFLPQSFPSLLSPLQPVTPFAQFPSLSPTSPFISYLMQQL